MYRSFHGANRHEADDEMDIRASESDDAEESQDESDHDHQHEHEGDTLPVSQTVELDASGETMRNGNEDEECEEVLDDEEDEEEESPNECGTLFRQNHCRPHRGMFEPY